jgi:hypothetical protein
MLPTFFPYILQKTCQGKGGISMPLLPAKGLIYLFHNNNNNKQHGTYIIKILLQNYTGTVQNVTVLASLKFIFLIFTLIRKSR